MMNIINGMDSRTRALLEAPITTTLLRMAWPNILVMVAQAATGLIETWFVSRLGTDALAGMALGFPGFMMMQMLSGGAVGGGISSAIARALGAGRRQDADALVLHAILVNVALRGHFPDEVMNLRQTFASESALGIQNARLFREITDKSRQFEPRAATSPSSWLTCRTSFGRRCTRFSASRRSWPSGCSLR
jgi:MatE